MWETYRVARFTQGYIYDCLGPAAVTTADGQPGRAAVERAWHGQVARIHYDVHAPSLARRWKNKGESREPTPSCAARI